MADLKLKLTRNQLAAFLNDYESIKQFEKLFATVDVISSDTIVEISIAVSVASSRAQQAVDGLDDVAGEVSRLEVERRSPLEFEPEDSPTRFLDVSLESLPDVRISLPTAGDSLKYDAVLNIWRNMP